MTVLGDGDPLPRGPFVVGLTWDAAAKRRTQPYTIETAGEPAIVVAGHIDSRRAAILIAKLLNAYDRKVNGG